MVRERRLSSLFGLGLPGLLTAAGCLLTASGGSAFGSPPPPTRIAATHQPGCRDGVCEPHCPVRPHVQGFYATQWRRWPGSERPATATDDSATPSGPPRSVVPGTDQESVLSADENLPPEPGAGGRPAAPSNPVAPPDESPVVRPLPSPPGPTMPLPPQAPPAAPPPARPFPGQPPSAPRDNAPPPAVTPEADQDLFGSRDTQARIAAVAARAEAARKGSAADQDRVTRGLIDSLLAEHDAGVRVRIVEEAAAFQTPAAEAICRGGMADPDPRVRFAACGVWERRGGPEAVGMLAARAADDADLGVRLRAIRGLGELGNEAATAALLPLLDDPDPAVQYRVCRALSRATGLNLGDDPKSWREWAARPADRRQRWSVRTAFPWLF